MNLIKYVVAIIMLTMLSACGGGGGSPGTSSGGSVAVTPLFTTAPASLILTSGSTSLGYNISGGVAPYSAGPDTPSLLSVSFSDATFTITATAGTSGSGTVVVTDAKGTKLSISVTVPAPAALFSTAPANLTLALGTSSSPYAITGGMGPYTVVSTNPGLVSASIPTGSTLLTISALPGTAGGAASVIVSDSRNTQLTIAVTVSSPAALFSTAPATLQILNGTTNFYSVFGGTSPYVVNTNGVIAKAVLSGSSLAITGMVPGNQTVAISDAKGASIIIDVTVKDGLFTDAPANLSLAVGTGATYSIYGGIPFIGTAPYRVNSSKPAVASASITGSQLSISGLASGSTSLVITDSVGAATLITVTVPVPDSILSTAPSNLSLAIGTSGIYAISGGVGPYTVASSNPTLVSASVNGSMLTIGAMADTVGGTANVIVSDAAGSPPLTIVVTAASVSFFTTAPSQLVIAAGASKVFAVFGGSPPYSVVNTHPAIALASVSGATLVITGSAAGSGTVILSDTKGKSVSIAVVVSAPGPLVLSAPSGNLTMASGTANTYNIIGGVPPYLASSSDLTVARATIVNANQIQVQAMGIGSARVAVTDSVGTQVSISITVPGTPVVMYTTAPAAGVFLANTDPPVSYDIYGGTPTYTVASSNTNVVRASLSVFNRFSLQAVAGGTAKVSVKDATGFTVTIDVTVGSANSFFVAAPATLNMGAGTSSTYQVSGGAKPYTVSSSDVRVATGVVDPVSSILTITALTSGTASLKIADALGAFYLITVVVDSTGGTGSGAAATIDILASSNTLNSTSGSLVNFIVTVKNGANAALPNQTVVFTASSGTLTGANPAPTTNAAGTISTVSLSPGADASNRSITVTATTGSISKSIVIPVVGTTISVSGPGAALVGSAPQNFTLKAVDSSGKPIVGAGLTIASTLGNGLSAQAVTTDTSGSGTVAFTAVNVGTDTLTVTGLGASGTATVVVSNVDFGFTAPAPAALLPVSVANTVSVRYRVAGVGVPGQTVSFATTRGTLYADVGLTIPATTAVTDGTGVATIYVKSDTAGTVTVSAQYGTARSSLTAAFVATVPATLVLQANPAALLPNAVGSTTNQSALTAIVRDAIGNPVQGVVVNFNAVTDASGGSIAPGSVTTDASGTATAQFIAGATSTAANGVTIRASVQLFPSISNTAALTVNGSALFISIARSNTLTAYDSTTYQKDFSVYVTDATGAPAGNRTVTLSVWPTKFGKGYLVYPAPSGPWTYESHALTPTSINACPNEDQNRNGVIDPLLIAPFTEDTNLNGKLDPGSPAVITSSVTTDALGFGTFTLRYGKNYAWWVIAQVTAKSLVSGTESSQVQDYVLEMTSDDAKSPSTPANAISPFGYLDVLAPSCSNPG